MSSKNQQLETEAGWFGNWFQWCPTSEELLCATEERILLSLKSPVRGKYVDIGYCAGRNDNKIWTLCLNEDSEKTPLVMLHGFGAGVGLWCLNLDALAATRPLYAIDLLGFGRSSRPAFSSDHQEAENQLVQSLEDWRKQMRLDNFILLGHSFGGYLATAYSLKYPKSILHLILAEPWGYTDISDGLNPQFPVPWWVKVLFYVFQPMNPLWGLRMAGPWGPQLIERVRPDIIRMFSRVLKQLSGDITDYIYHCNAQSPSGESAFHAMMKCFIWAKLPMINRIPDLSKDIPVTFIYGSRSWMKPTGLQVQEMRRGLYVDVQIIRGAGHDIYAQRYQEFNKIVTHACDISDSKDQQKEKMAKYSEVVVVES